MFIGATNTFRLRTERIVCPERFPCNEWTGIATLYVGSRRLQRHSCL